MNVVYVLSPERIPLMPCTCVIARMLLKHGKAKVVRRTPFTIKLLSPPETSYTQPLTLGIDTGSSVIGSAVSDERGNILYLSDRTTSMLAKKCVSDGDYQQTKGKHSRQRITTGKIGGYRKFDKVLYLGQDSFIKGRMTTGYAILMDLSGNTMALKPIPKFGKMRRVSARSSWMMLEQPMPPF
jgi:hypothetical protein